MLDQFEEVLTCNVTPERQSLFQQLKELLSNDERTIWLLISMREEYFSWLDDFRDDIPTRLNNTYRLNLLSVEQAVAAIKAGRSHGRRFSSARRNRCGAGAGQRID